MGRSSQVWVGSLFGSGQLRLKYVRVKFGFGYVSSQLCSGWYWFGWVEVWVGSILGDATVTWFTSGIGPIYFGLGEIRFSISVNVRSGAN